MFGKVFSIFGVIALVSFLDLHDWEPFSNGIDEGKNYSIFWPRETREAIYNFTLHCGTPEGMTPIHSLEFGVTFAAALFLVFFGCAYLDMGEFRKGLILVGMAIFCPWLFYCIIGRLIYWCFLVIAGSILFFKVVADDTVKKFTKR